MFSVVTNKTQKYGSKRIGEMQEDLVFDVIIVGAGVAGTAAASVLARAGFSVAIVDSNDRFPDVFRAEIMGSDHVALLDSMGLLDALRPVGTKMCIVEEAWRGVRFKRNNTEHYSLSYEVLVNTLRTSMPTGVHFINAKVRCIKPSSGTSTVYLSDGKEFTSRLVVLATGASGNLYKQLNITKRIVSRMHSITFGAFIEPAAGQAFNFQELTYWGDNDEAMIMLATFFPLGSSMRFNLVTHWQGQDPRTTELMNNPNAVLEQLMPRLRQITGYFDVVGRVDARPIHIHAVEGHIQPGLVLVGDAFSISCPGIGTGVSKALNDVEILSRKYVPQWLASSGMGVDKITQFYEDSDKKRYDKRTLDMSLRTHLTAVDPDPFWRMRRYVRLLKRKLVIAVHPLPARTPHPCAKPIRQT